MKFIKNISLLLLVSIVVFSSCSRKKKNIAAGYIPADASAVLSINANQLMKKLSDNGVNYQKIAGAIFGSEGDTAASTGVFWPQADSSGIDFDQPIYASLSVPTKITDKNAIIRVVIQLKDAKKFAKTISFIDGEIKKEDKLTFVTLDESAFGYNDKTAIYVAHLNADALTGTKTTGVFSLDSLDDAPEQASFSGKIAADIVRASFNMDSKNSLASNELFDEMPIDKNDMKLWLNYTYGISSMLKGDASAVALVMEPLLKDSYISSVLNFEKGKISSTARMYFRKEAAEVIKKAAERNIDLSIVSTFPGKELNAYMGMAYDTSLLRGVIQYINAEGLINAALAGSGLNTQDLINCFSGDISVLVADVQAANGAGQQMEKANWAVVAKLNNKTSLEKLMNSPMVSGLIKKEGNDYVLAKDSDKIYFNIKDTHLFLAGNQPLLTQYMAGTAKNNFAEGPLARFAKKPLGSYFSLGGKTPAGNAPNIQAVLTGMFQDMITTGEHFEKNYLQTATEINMTNKEQNSLAALFNASFNFMQTQMKTMMEQAGQEDIPRLVPMTVK